ncbi:MAG: hypothetical protein Q7R41_04090 [Phycisphaerales bacterium]|nr:hypothetical protein [Phycisphaerales bacterium]
MRVAQRLEDAEGKGGRARPTAGKTKTYEHVIGVARAEIEDIESITGLDVSFGERAVLDDGAQAAAHKRTQPGYYRDGNAFVSIVNYVSMRWHQLLTPA